MTLTEPHFVVIVDEGEEQILRSAGVAAWERAHLRRLLLVRETHDKLALAIEVLKSEPAPEPVIVLPPEQPTMQRPPGRNPYVAPRQRPPKTLGVKRR